MKPWITLNRKKILDVSPWLTVFQETVQIENEIIIKDFYTIDQNESVVIFAIFDHDKIIGIRSYKHGPKKITLGLPAGYINSGETPLTSAKRELLEETGYKAKKWKKLGSYIVEGNRGCGRVHIYFANDLEKKQKPQSGDLESISIELVQLDMCYKLLTSGKIATLGVAVAVCMGLLYLIRESKKVI